MTASLTWPSCTRVRVPGKVILSGEHAVVYGAPALACAIKKYAFAATTNNRLAGVHLRVPEFGIDQHYTPVDLLHLAQQTQTRHSHYLASTCPLSSVVSSPAEFFAAALGASGLVPLLKDLPGLSIELTMDLVAGGGMGSSAALVAAMLASAFKHIGQPLAAAELISKTTQSEHWQHGRSSGLDPYVCVMGGLQQYQQGTGTLHPSNAFTNCYLVTTGKPLSSTGDCVEAVKHRAFSASFWQQFATVQQRLLAGMQAGKTNAMISAIADNHKLLQRIGVVPKAVSNFIHQVELDSGAAKVCGAGSVSGDQGGLVFAVGLESTHMQQLCRTHGYGVEAMQPDLDGVTYIDPLSLTSSKVITSAPANTMLMGEHAVLFGHSALVCALTPRIYISAQSRTDELVIIVSQLGHYQAPLAELTAAAQQNSLFSFVLQALALCELKQGVHLSIESDFEHTLGLGSSAAVTVATLGAIELLTKGQFDKQNVMSLGIQSIRKVQGRGSGADVAASALGGIVKFQAQPVSAKTVSISAQAWKNAPNLRLVYCGYKTPTPVVIEQVAKAAQLESKRFEQLYEQMGACVEATMSALNNDDWQAFAQAMDQYQGLMESLGVSDDTIRDIIQLGQKQIKKDALFAAKISGSGLGDCVLLLGCEELDWPHTQLPVQIDPQGLRQEIHLPSHSPT